MKSVSAEIKKKVPDSYRASSLGPEACTVGELMSVLSGLPRDVKVHVNGKPVVFTTLKNADCFYDCYVDLTGGEENNDSDIVKEALDRR